MKYLIATQQSLGEAVCRQVIECWRLPSEPPSVVRMSAETKDQLRQVALDHDPRYIFFVHWSNYVPKSVFGRWECVNFHCTPLPFGRGGNPIENMLRLGFSETIITAHRITAAVDAGPIYTRSRPVSLAGTRAEILQRFIEPIADMVRAICKWEHVPVEQDIAGRFGRLADSVSAEIWKGRGC